MGCGYVDKPPFIGWMPLMSHYLRGLRLAQIDIYRLMGWIQARIFPHIAVESRGIGRIKFFVYGNDYESPAISPLFIQTQRTNFSGNFCELSTFRISYPQFLGIYPQFGDSQALEGGILRG